MQSHRNVYYATQHTLNAPEDMASGSRSSHSDVHSDVRSTISRRTATSITSHGYTPSVPASRQSTKSKSSFMSFGKKAVKEILGGGGNNSSLKDTPVPLAPKVVVARSYGRGGAGRAFKKEKAPPLPVPQSTHAPSDAPFTPVSNRRIEQWVVATTSNSQVPSSAASISTSASTQALLPRPGEYQRSCCDNHIYTKPAHNTDRRIDPQQCHHDQHPRRAPSPLPSPPFHRPLTPDDTPVREQARYYGYAPDATGYRRDHDHVEKSRSRLPDSFHYSASHVPYPTVRESQGNHPLHDHWQQSSSNPTADLFGDRQYAQHQAHYLKPKPSHATLYSHHSDSVGHGSQHGHYVEERYPHEIGLGPVGQMRDAHGQHYHDHDQQRRRAMGYYDGREHEHDPRQHHTFDDRREQPMLPATGQPLARPRPPIPYVSVSAPYEDGPHPVELLEHPTPRVDIQPAVTSDTAQGLLDAIIQGVASGTISPELQALYQAKLKSLLAQSTATSGVPAQEAPITSGPTLRREPSMIRKESIDQHSADMGHSASRAAPTHRAGADYDAPRATPEPTTRLNGHSTKRSEQYANLHGAAFPEASSASNGLSPPGYTTQTRKSALKGGRRLSSQVPTGPGSGAADSPSNSKGLVWLMSEMKYDDPKMACAIAEMVMKNDTTVTDGAVSNALEKNAPRSHEVNGVRRQHESHPSTDSESVLETPTNGGKSLRQARPLPTIGAGGADPRGGSYPRVKTADSPAKRS